MANMVEQVEQISNAQEDIQQELLALSKLIQQQQKQHQKDMDELSSKINAMQDTMELLTAPPEPPERPRNDDGMSKKGWALVAAGIVFLLLLHVLPPVLAVGNVQDTAKRILWNQSYGNMKPVTPFTSSDDFNKEYDNQRQYVEAQEQQKGEK